MSHRYPHMSEGIVRFLLFLSHLLAQKAKDCRLHHENMPI